MAPIYSVYPDAEVRALIPVPCAAWRSHPAGEFARLRPAPGDVTLRADQIFVDYTSEAEPPRGGNYLVYSRVVGGSASGAPSRAIP